ncbi:transcriptional regulator with XRE-family HTH domain [Pseudomonas sp. TE24901]
MKEITQRLREERKRLSLTQEELAIMGGVKVNAQSIYE